MIKLVLQKRIVKLNREEPIFINKQFGLKCENILRAMPASAIRMKKG